MPLCRGALKLTVLDVDSSPDLQVQYGLRVPVLLDGDQVICEARLDRAAVLALLPGSPATGPEA